LKACDTDALSVMNRTASNHTISDPRPGETVTRSHVTIAE
jgi:hypothetical protein